VGKIKREGKKLGVRVSVVVVVDVKVPQDKVLLCGFSLVICFLLCVKFLIQILLNPIL
jgi:hypothetical protein